jgi:hypothetical protein
MKQVSSNQAFCFLQPVELVGTGLAGEFYVGSTWTFSFWMKGSGSGSISLGPEFRDEGISGTNLVAAASSTTINYTSSWTRYSFTFTITGTPAGTNTGLSCILYQGSQTGSLWATGFQLEKGSVATPFEFRPLATELQLCQRYYYTSASASIYMAGQAYTASGVDGLRQSYPYPVNMRATPSASVSGGTDGQSQATLSVLTTTATTAILNLISTSGSDTAVWWQGATLIASAEI